MKKVTSTVLLTLGVLITGVAIPIILSFQNQYVIHDKDKEYHFIQPLLQTTMIFLGEIICMFMLNCITNTQAEDTSMNIQQPNSTYTWSTLWFILPSSCDLMATTLMNLGLFYTSPSVYQMVKSSIAAFTAVFSSLFFSRQFVSKEWRAIMFMFMGTLTIVGSIVWSTSGYMGTVFLLAAQLLLACQFVMEEYWMAKLHLDPIKAMSVEIGLGSVLLSGALGVFSVYGTSAFDVQQGLRLLLNHAPLCQSALLLAAMVALFNFLGLTVSKAIDIPGRSIIDTLRTMLTWIVAIYCGWDHFHWIQLMGFIIITYGIYQFNGVFNMKRSEERTPLLS